MEKQRVEWIDIFKLLGIVAIFCGHLGTETGGLHDFVFMYHVPLFFFASGIFAYQLEKLSLGQAVKKKFTQIVLPYSFIVVLTMIMIILTTEEDFYTYLRYGKQFIAGIRNQMYASSLWFFSCLFCMSILFDLLRRILKKRSLLLIASIVIYFITIFVFPNRPDQQPSWIFNIDSACHYLIYYAIGHMFYEKLTEEKTEASKKERLLLLVGIILLAGYVVLVYLHKDVIGKFLYQSIPGMEYVYPVIRVLLLILFNIILAKMLVGIGKLGEIGSQTLWLCGNEFIVKKILNALADILGVQIKIASALSAILYAIVMVFVIIKILMPIEKKLYQRFVEILRLESNL
ncbi:MAG: acyltransferase [Lachnospiraceae bacterium]|nr:acyltransferase [Lachnospiraceae bacterium]